MKNTAFTPLQRPIYEVFIIGASLLALNNVALKIIFSDNPLVLTVIAMIDVPMSLIFLLDFFYRLRSSPSKREYFFRRFGWADLLSGLPYPYFKLLRLFYLGRVTRHMRALGGRGLLRDFLAHSSGAALLVVLFLILLVLEFGSVGIVLAESGSPEANIIDASDALWWVYVTVATVGYGDRYPTTNMGRMIGALVMTVGVGLFSVLTSFLANTFLAPKNRETSPQKTEKPAPTAGDPLGEIKTLLAEQQAIQSRLEQRIQELEDKLKPLP